VASLQAAVGEVGRLLEETEGQREGERERRSD